MEFDLGDVAVIVGINIVVNYICFLFFLCAKAVYDANKVVQEEPHFEEPLKGTKTHEDRH
jgi:hypothetical protein